jgi:hypothetical protein
MGHNMKNTQDLKDTLDHAMIRSINRMISSKFSIPLSKYGIEVEDFISNLYVLAYKRGTFDKSKAKVSTYFYWMARTEMSHIRDSKKIVWAYGTPIINEAGQEQIFIEDTSLRANPLAAMEAVDTSKDTFKLLAEHFGCSVNSINMLLSAEPKEVMNAAKEVIHFEAFNAEEAKAFLAKVKTARSLGGFARSK